MVWHHTECVAESEPAAIFTCESCSTISADIKQVSTHMTTIIKQIATMSKDMVELRKQFDDVKTQNETTKCDNALLKSEVLKLRAELAEQNWPRQAASTKTKPALVVGSSILRDIDNSKVENTYVHTISGGKIEHVLTYLSDVPSDKFGELTLIVGGNDCAEPTSVVTDVVDNYNKLVDAAKEKATSVNVASILPRKCPGSDTQEKIDSVNAALQVLSGEKNCSYINNDTIFRLQNGSINDGYYLTERNTEKMVHLNDKGTQKLCELLNVKPKTGAKVTKDRHQNNNQNNSGPQSRNQRTAPPRTSVHQVQRQQRGRQTPPPSNETMPQQHRMPHYPIEPSRPHREVSPTRVDTPRWSRGGEPASRPPPRRQHDYPPPDHSYYTQHHEQRSAPQTQTQAPQVDLPVSAPSYTPPRAYNSTTYAVTQAPHFQTSVPSYTPPPPSYTPPPRTYNSRPTVHTVDTCQNCYERGHVTQDCWYNERLRCTYCHSTGHKQRDCPYLESKRIDSYPQNAYFSY